MSHNENLINILVRVTKSSKFQALQVLSLVTAISTQIFSENTMILLALHSVKEFLYLDLTLVYAWYATVCNPSL